MYRHKTAASIAGSFFALAWPFFNWSPVLRHVPAPDIVAKFAAASVLSAIAFAVNRRSLKFFHIQAFGSGDIGAALLAFPAMFGLIAVVKPVIDHLEGAGTGAFPVGDPGISLGSGLATAVSAGVFEEFIYRGFVIEELGRLIGSRPLAACVSVVFFALAHRVSYGWSLELVYVGLKGVVFTLLYFWRRNLPVCMLVHATQDCLGLFVR